jgi:hypothetical protein
VEVQAKIDPVSREIVLLYKEDEHLNAEVYRFHDGKNRIATHYKLIDVTDEYLKEIRDPLPFEEKDVRDAITFYQDLILRSVKRS